MNIEKSIVIEAAKKYQEALQEFLQTEHVPFVHTFIQPGFSNLKESEALEMKERLIDVGFSVDDQVRYNANHVEVELGTNLSLRLIYDTDKERLKRELQRQLEEVQKQLALL